jgi:Co/Zn/Cd efflux system component
MTARRYIRTFGWYALATLAATTYAVVSILLLCALAYAALWVGLFVSYTL